MNLLQPLPRQKVTTRGRREIDIWFGRNIYFSAGSWMFGYVDWFGEILNTKFGSEITPRRGSPFQQFADQMEEFRLTVKDQAYDLSLGDQDVFQ